jgi:hypothetical protein
MVDAEYGNQGVDFKMIPREGFGWMNGLYSVTASPVSIEWINDTWAIHVIANHSRSLTHLAICIYLGHSNLFLFPFY